MHREEIPTRYSMQTNHSPPLMAYPSSYPYCGISMSTVYRTWTQTNGHPANVNMRGPPDYRHWPQPGTQPWNSYAGVTFSILKFHCEIARFHPQPSKLKTLYVTALEK